MRIKVNQPKSCALAIAAILFAQLQPAFTQSVDQSGDSGVVSPGAGGGGTSLNFQADLFTGRFTYAVPIKVIPGRQGAEPKLTLGYNSAAGNGWCGVGWTLDTGYIQRDIRKGVPIQWAQAYFVTGPSNNQQTNYYDYNTPLPKYDDSNGFIANIGNVNSSLVLVGPTNQNPIVYRQQVDTAFLTYNYYSNNYWTVVDKSGNTFYFGEGATNQMENPKLGWAANSGSSTFRWALDKVVDVNGNETFLKYTTDGGMLYLTNITYNANLNSPVLAATHEVDFILTNRSDANITFNSGYRIQIGKRLSEIDVKVSGANVRKYVLNYTNSPSTLRSLLTSVTEYGTNFTSALPPITFSYQVKPFRFGPATNWTGLYSQGETSSGWNSSRSTDSDGDTYVKMVDIDGDGLPDRVMRDDSSPYTYFASQRNTGANFTPSSASDYQWGPMDSQGQHAKGWNSPAAQSTSDQATYVDMQDINGDGLPDRVMRSDLYATNILTIIPGLLYITNTTRLPYTNFVVQFNNGNGFMPATLWTNVDDYETSDDNENWCAVRYKHAVDLLDMNGDGLPDRVSRKINSPFDCFKVQLNTGAGFTRAALWSPLDSQGQTTSDWNGVSAVDGNKNLKVVLVDINGDGLPDRVMRSLPVYVTNIVTIIPGLLYVTNTTQVSYTNFVVQFNNGAGFEPAEPWGALDNQGQATDIDWNSPIGTDGTKVRSTLIDINGDGLPDRVMRKVNGPYTNWLVQLNTGTGFAPSVSWGPLDSQGKTSFDWNDISANNGSGVTYVDFFDINGDGLPDRVMRSEEYVTNIVTIIPGLLYSTNITQLPYTNFVVQLNQGPFPDLLCVASNGLGGSVQVGYVASTTLDNRNTNWISDPWAEGTKSLLPFNVWVVSQIAASDGMGNTSTNTYAFKGGYYNTTEKEFRGFSQATMTDPLGTKTITYFHQNGGRDNSALGEYLDQGSESKKGIPFRIEVIGSDGATNKITLSKVEEVMLNSNGWYFPFISQSIVMTYEGLSSYRAVAKQFAYDTNTENLVMTANLGEVTNVVVQGQTFTDVGNDSVYTWITYETTLGGILNKPSDVKNTSDSAGTSRLRETQMSYDSHGRMTSSQVWLDSAGTFVSAGSSIYDQYGNLVQSTDAAGVTTTTTYDSTYEQYPVSATTGTFSSSITHDIRSGLTLTATDIKGLVTSNAYDVFFRPIASYISTSAYGAPTLWQSRTYYSSGGISGGISYNYIHSQVNDAVDPVNGYETYTYADGLGRTIETREEAENGQFRVANACYDKDGNPYFKTLPYFSSGTGFTIINGTYLGALTEYDNVGRSFRVTPAVQGSFISGRLVSTSATSGDGGSPLGPATTAFVDGGNPWATVATDSEGKVKKSYRDAYGRTITITEVTTNGNYNTTYSYDLLGNPTNVTDSANNSTRMVYDSLGRKTSMTDPDMGAWSYNYDSAGRMTQQNDARGNKLTFSYNDQLGRITSKGIYDSGNHLKGTITYTYDAASDDPNYTVYPGQLYKVTDLQGYQRSSYDIRGRVLKTGRFLNVNAMEYVTQAAYDDADRVQQLTYPGNSATIKYTYDTAGNLIQVKSLAGTGTQETFYTPQGFNALGQVTAYTDGAGVVTTNIYYANSKRLQRVWVSKGTTNLQDLSYTYDTVSDLKSINDGVYTGTASASISGITYDDLYRVKSLNSTARGTKAYAYNSIGNILTNQDFGPGSYQYGAKPHAVTSANGVNYAYDACGNMTTRGSQTLTYDEQNQLNQVSGTNLLVTFGYDEDGERLWRRGTNGYTIWIGGIYEINNGKVLCHVLADGKLVATFEQQCGGLWSKAFGEKKWYVASTTIQSALNWPFQKGRGFWTVFTGTWVGIIGVCMLVGRGTTLRRYEIRKVLRPSCLWRQAVTVVAISAFLGATTQDVEAATYSPVFYYYHSDNLGSSNVLTDRSGNVVQHYEYATFGQTSFTDNTSAFPISNRFTGQIADDETGLYYYGARYYDPQLGRFIQPDTIVQSPDNPQTLNRYSYCGNNPLNYTDPTGNIFGIDDLIAAIVIGALIGGAIGGIVAAATGGNVLKGILGGAIAGALVGVGIGAADWCVALGMVSQSTAPIITAAGGALGGAAGGAASAAIQGGNIGMGALIGAISGAVAGYLDPVTSNGVSYNATSSAGGRSLTVEMFAPSRTPFPVSTGGGITLTPSEASAAGGAVTAAGTAAMNGGIGAPSTLVSMIPVIGSAWESAHYFSTGHWVMGTALAGMAVLDLTGVGEAGGMMLKMGLKVAEKTTAKIAAERSGAYLLKFESGRMYIGKGLESRMWQSASRIESAGDKVVSATHFPAANGREAFIKEYQLMKETGQRPLHWDPNSKLYNKIWSPGKKLSGE